MADTNSIRFDSNPYHNIVLKDRKYLEISGVKKIENFDEESFMIESVQGWIEVEGNELTLDKLDKERGEIIIKGNIDTIHYVSGKKQSVSLVSKIFR